jgi:hypothetical protein
VPLQLPEAVQLVAFVDDQVIFVELPITIEVAASVSVGAAGIAVPPLPPQEATRMLRRVNSRPLRNWCEVISTQSPVMSAY